MTKKDFQIIADAFRQGMEFAVYKDSDRARAQHALQCNEMALALRNTNPRFDRIKFLRACGLSESDVEAL